MKKTKKEIKKRKVGRPTNYTPELGDKICEAISNKVPLARLCNDNNDMPVARTVYRWLREFDEFSRNYTKAKEDQADLMVEEMLEIADNSTPASFNVDRLRVDTRKWAASKFKRKSYGDKSEVDISGNLEVKQLNIPARPTREQWLVNIQQDLLIESKDLDTDQ